MFLKNLKFTTFWKHSKAIKNETIHLVLSYLDAGVDFENIRDILNLKETTLESFTQQVYWKYPTVYLDLKDKFSYLLILKYFYEYQEFVAKLKKQFFSLMTYPLILFVSVYVLLGFFLRRIIPTMMDMVQSFNVDLGFLSIILSIMKCVFIVLSIVFIFSILLGLLLLVKQNQKICVILFNKFRWFNLVKMIYTQMFATMFCLLLNLGASTRQILEIMQDSTLSYFVCWLAQLTSYELEDGQTLSASISNHYLDDQFVRFIQLSSVDNKVGDYLDTYLQLNEKRIVSVIAQFASRLKLFTYCLLGLLIVLMYQVLLSPMQMMSII